MFHLYSDSIVKVGGNDAASVYRDAIGQFEPHDNCHFVLLKSNGLHRQEDTKNRSCSHMKMDKQRLTLILNWFTTGSSY